MVPFVADHPLFHPSEEIKEACESGILPGIHSLSGESLRFFRSEIPVAVFRLSDLEFENWRKEIQKRPSSEMSTDHRIDMVEDSRWKIQWADRSGQVHTAIIKKDADSRNPLFFTVDRLKYTSDRWAGDTEAESDYSAGLLRPINNVKIDIYQIFRSCIIAGMCDFEIHNSLFEAIADRTALELPRRFQRKQLIRLLLSARPSQGFIALEKAGYLNYILPELQRAKGLSQNRHHRYDIFYHLIYACDHAKPELHLRLAALLHDIGKVDTRKVKKNGEATFYNHEVVGAKVTEKIMKRFGFDPNLGKRVRFLVRNHMFHYTGEWTDRAVRRFMNRVSENQLKDLIELRLADRKGSGKRSQLPAAIIELMSRMKDVRARQEELKITDLKINGKDLMQLGIQPGKSMGDILKQLLTEVKEEKTENLKEDLLARAKEISGLA